MLRQQREALNNLGLVRYDQQDYPARETILQQVTLNSASNQRQNCNRDVLGQPCDVGD